MNAHSDSCPHCGHGWETHHVKRCTECGCYWQKPKPPEPPKPPPDPRIAIIRNAIYAELDNQHENDVIQGAGYWDSEYGCLDGEPNWDAVCAAILAALDNRPTSDA